MVLPASPATRAGLPPRSSRRLRASSSSRAAMSARYWRTTPGTANTTIASAEPQSCGLVSPPGVHEASSTLTQPNIAVNASAAAMPSANRNSSAASASTAPRSPTSRRVETASATTAMHATETAMSNTESSRKYSTDAPNASRPTSGTAWRATMSAAGSGSMRAAAAGAGDGTNCRARRCLAMPAPVRGGTPRSRRQTSGASARRATAIRSRSRTAAFRSSRGRAR